MSVATHPLHVHLVTEQVARWSEQSLLEELYLTVKPGLIDKSNNGAHLDMTLAMMEHRVMRLLLILPKWHV